MQWKLTHRHNHECIENKGGKTLSYDPNLGIPSWSAIFLPISRPPLPNCLLMVIMVLFSIKIDLLVVTFIILCYFHNINELTAIF